MLQRLDFKVTFFNDVLNMLVVGQFQLNPISFFKRVFIIIFVDITGQLSVIMSQL